MRKVKKIFIWVIAVPVITAVCIPLLAGLSLYIPGVQRFAIDQATRFVSKKLDTKVTVDAIHLKLFNAVAVDGIYIEDYRGDTLIHVKRIQIGVRKLGLGGATPTLGKVTIDEPRLYMYHDSAGTSNLRRVMLKMSSDKESDSTKIFRLDAGAIRINNLSFRNHNNPEPEQGVNIDDIDVRGFNLKGDNISVVNDSITLAIGHISFVEKSGLSVTGLSCGRFNISGRGIYIDRLLLETPDSRLEADYLRMVTGTWGGYSEFIKQVRFETEIKRSKVSFRTIAYFAPTLKDVETVFDDVECRITGPIADFGGVLESARVRETRVKVDFRIKGIPEMTQTIFDLDIDELHTTNEDVIFFANDFPGFDSGGITPYITDLNGIDIKGGFKGTFSNFGSNLDIATTLGRLNLGITMATQSGGLSAFNGKLATSNLDIGSLLSSTELGGVTMNADFKGSIGAGDLVFDTKTHISRLEFNGYGYRGLNITGKVDHRVFSGNIASSDVNADFDLKGVLDFSDSIPKYDFVLDLERADLAKLNLNKRDSTSVLSCDMRVRGMGFSVDNINGRVNISNLNYRNHVDSVSLGDIVITGRNNQSRKYLAVNSDVLDLEYRSKMSYYTLFDYIKQRINTYLPTLSDYNEDKVGSEYISQADSNDVNNYSVVRLNIKEANNVAGIFLPGLQLAVGTSLSLMVNPDANTLNFSLNSKYIEKNDFFASDINLNGRNNESDSLLVYLSAKDLYTGNIHVPGINIIGGAKNNTIRLKGGYSYPQAGSSALIGLTSSLERDSVTDMRQIRVRFEPSYFSSGEQTWRIVSKDIVYDSTRVTIDDFRILGRGQNLSIRGAISDAASDSLSLRLNNFNLGSLSELVKITGYDISGYANGGADMISVTNSGIMTADMSFDSLRVNKIEVPPILFRSKWDFGRGGAGFEISRRDTAETIVRGLYLPSKNELLAKLTFSGLEMALLDPVLEGVLSGTRGSVEADIDLRLKEGKLNLNGTAVVSDLSTKVDFLNVPYSIKQTKVNVVNSVISVADATVYDPRGNTAVFNMDLDLSSFSNMKYNIGIAPSNMLVLNTNIDQNNLFYGTVFASGSAVIRGDKRGVDMDISATTSNNSRFFMPLSDKSKVAMADYIVFETPDNLADTTDILTRKRLMFEQRQKRGTSSDRAAMNIKLNIGVRPNTDFQLVIDPVAGDMIKARGSGDLRLSIDPGNNEFSMYGDYEIAEGIYHLKLKNLLDRKFEINPGGTIRWTGDPIDALLDINAVYKLKTSLYPLTGDQAGRKKVPVECDIKLTDRLSKPTVLFDVRVPSADAETQSMIGHALNTQELKAKQFVWLATVGSFATNENGGFNISSGGNSFGYDLLFSQLSNMMSTDKLSIGLRYTPASELSSDEVSIDLQTQVFSDRLTLEFEGSYDTQNNPTTINNPNNLSGNFIATWMIDPSGNLTLKGFTRTIERFDETQEQQESGVGIYYREDFNKFRDIIVNLRKRFSKKWRERYRQQDAARYAGSTGSKDESKTIENNIE